jgi:hypothetical protein
MYAGEKTELGARDVPATNDVSSTNTVKPPLVTIIVANWG